MGPERDFAGHFGRQLGQHGRCGNHVGLGEYFFEGFHAEVVVGVSLAHVDGGELLAAIEHVGGDAQGVGTGKACVNDDGVFLAIDQGGIDVEAVGVCVVNLDAERLLGVGSACHGGECNGQRSGDNGSADHGELLMMVGRCEDVSSALE